MSASVDLRLSSTPWYIIIGCTALCTFNYYLSTDHDIAHTVLGLKMILSRPIYVLLTGYPLRKNFGVDARLY